MMNFISAIKNATNIDYTQNAALSKKTTTSAVLDFYSKSGALRGQLEESLKYFIKAFGENPDLAAKALFYARDVRGGQGERDLFKICFLYLAKKYPKKIKHLVHLIPEYGRWDDLYILFGTSLEDEAISVIKEQLKVDSKSENPSLLAKWLKSVNTSSKKSRELGRKTADKLGMKEPKYRKLLSKLRKKIDVVEKKISQNRWGSVEYAKVPSQAMMKYRNAFLRNDPNRFKDFIERVSEGKEKINTGTLYPYQISSKVRNSSSADEIKTLDEMWKNLPNYLEGGEKAIAVVDTSGSMIFGASSNVVPLDVSLSLGLYFAERNEGPFKNTFITFSANPELQTITGYDIQEKILNLSCAHWERNTNLKKVFELILKVAKENEIPEEQLPDKIYIISDMQFDIAVNDNSLTNFDIIDKMYIKAGYDRPDLVFWNVNAYSDIPVKKDETGTFLVSGLSPSILKYAMNCEAVTPYQLMLETLRSSRYEPICLNFSSWEGHI